MILRMLLWAVVVLVVPGGLLLLAAKPALKRLAARRQGRLNAANACSLCSETTHPETDHFDSRTKRWTHARCVAQLLN